MAPAEPAAVAKRSLRGRLLLARVAPLAVLFLLGGAVSYGLAQHFANSVYDGWLFDSVSSLALSLEAERGPDGASAVTIAPSTRRLFEWDVSDNTYFRVASAHGGVILGRPDLPAPPDKVKPYEAASLDNASLEGQPVRVAVLELPAARFGEAVTVTVAETMRKRRELAHAILVSTLVPQLLLIVVASAAIRRAIGHGLAPLRTVTQRLQSSSHRQLAPISDDDVPSEIRPMTRALNELLARLESALSAQQRFIAEAAHQLRTPLTAIKLQADAMAREPVLEDARPQLESLRIATDRAARLSNQLLSLARAEPEGSAALAFAPVDLVALVRDLGAEWAPRALARGVEMQLAADSEEQAAWIEGNAELLREAVANLIDNAIKYHAGPGSIELRVTAAPAIEVEDDGPGVPCSQRAQMLQRFIRGGQGQGSGLGLSIALEIARLHGGDLQLRDGRGGRGLRAILLLAARGGQS